VTARDRAEEAFVVASYESDFLGTLSIHALFNHFQELAGQHATVLGVGFEKLRDSGIAWLLSRITLRIDALPKWGDSVTLYTWPKGVDRLFALRDFKLQNSKGETLVCATSCWLAVDLEKERPRRIETLAVDLSFPHAEHAIHEVPDKITAVQSLTPALEVQALPSDLDVNEHVNNANYARWITDCFDLERLRARRISGLQVNYLKQVLKGDHVSISTAVDPATPGREYVQGVRSGDRALAFQAVVTWQ
jgi:medium-chain acyl-[acyl-carrier-protein] hydrolase